MNEDDKHRLDAQNHRVRRWAEKQPTKGLEMSAKALGYRGDIQQSTDTVVVVHGFSMETIAKMSYGKPYHRSERQLRDDLNVFISSGVATKELGKRYGSNQPTNTITLDLTKVVPAEAIEQRRHNREESAEWQRYIDSMGDDVIDVPDDDEEPPRALPRYSGMDDWEVEQRIADRAERWRQRHGSDAAPSKRDTTWDDL